MLEEGGVPHDNLRAFIPYFSSPPSILFSGPHLSPPSIIFLSFRGGGEIGGGEADSIKNLEFGLFLEESAFPQQVLSNLWIFFLVQSLSSNLRPGFMWHIPKPRADVPRIILSGLEKKRRRRPRSSDVRTVREWRDDNRRRRRSLTSWAFAPPPLSIPLACLHLSSAPIALTILVQCV